MRIFTVMLRTLVLTAALCLAGCGGDSGTNSGGNDAGGNATHTHTWGPWNVTTLMTCDGPRVETRICIQDSRHKETRELERLWWWVGCEPDGEPNNCGTDGTAGSCKTVVIGGQTWMAENLNIATDGSRCSGSGMLMAGGDTYTLTSTEIQANCDTYGRLYTWEAAKAACQSVGWRLPDEEDWNRLVDAAGGGSKAGMALKAARGWNNKSDGSSGNGTDTYGWSALPGGFGVSGASSSVGALGYWWVDDGSERNHDYRIMYNYTTTVVNGNATVSSPCCLSVRCIAD